MQTIADELGVSKSLVSKALSNQSGVSEKTKEQIRLTAIKLGYRINSSLQSVPSSKTGNVAAILPREDLQDFEYWGNIVKGIEGELSEKKYSVIVAGIDSSQPTSVGMPSSITDRKVDGALILGQVPLSYILAVQATGIPVVLVDTHHNQLKLDHVLAENFSGGYEATQYLLKKNHRKIGFVGDPSYASSFMQRFNGFNAALHDFNESASVQAEAVHLTATRDHPILPYSPQQLKEALQKPDRPTALVCGNDPVAFDVLQELSTLSIRCPDEISVIGFDNLQKCDWVSPALTSIDASKDLMGVRAAQMLIRRINNPELRSEHTMITTEVVERESVKALDL